MLKIIVLSDKKDNWVKKYFIEDEFNIETTRAKILSVILKNEVGPVLVVSDMIRPVIRAPTMVKLLRKSLDREFDMLFLHKGEGVVFDGVIISKRGVSLLKNKKIKFSAFAEEHLNGMTVIYSRPSVMEVVAEAETEVVAVVPEVAAEPEVVPENISPEPASDVSPPIVESSVNQPPTETHHHREDPPVVENVLPAPPPLVYKNFEVPDYETDETPPEKFLNSFPFEFSSFAISSIFAILLLLIFKN